VPVFVLAGDGLDSKDVTEETLRAKIKSYGAEIRTDVDLGTSFLIALKNYDKSPLYNKARELGVAVVREREILEYMGL
jgi:NAD-dependent DNA ligase